MMTWAPCPHGVRTRGKKRGLFPQTFSHHRKMTRFYTLNEGESASGRVGFLVGGFLFWVGGFLLFSPYAQT